MNKRVNDLYRLAKSKGYPKTEDEFYSEVRSGGKTFDNVYKLAKAKKYEGDESDLLYEIGLEDTETSRITGEEWDKLGLDERVNYLVDNDIVDVMKYEDIPDPKGYETFTDDQKAQWENYKANKGGVVDQDKLRDVIDGVSTAPYAYRKLATDDDIGVGDVAGAVGKDILSSPGRVIGAGVDQLAEYFGDGEAENVMSTSLGDAQPGGLIQDVVRDPWLLPSVAAGGPLMKGVEAVGAKVLPAVASEYLLKAAPKLAPAAATGIRGALAGGAEEAIIQGSNDIADDGSVNYGNIPIAMALGGAADVGGELLGQRAKGAWDNLFGSKAQKVRNADQAIDEAYNNIPYQGKINYDTKGEINNINNNIANYSEGKRDLYNTVDQFDFLERSLRPDTDYSMFTDEKLQNQLFNKHMVYPQDNIGKGNIERSIADAKANLDTDYVNHNKSAGAVKEQKESLDNSYQNYMVPRNTIPDHAPVSATQLHNSRMSLDQDERSLMNKLNTPNGLGETGEAVMTARTIINDEIDNRTNKMLEVIDFIDNKKGVPIENQLFSNPDYAESAARLSTLNTYPRGRVTFDNLFNNPELGNMQREAALIPGEYSKRDVLQTIGGSTGNLNRTSGSLLGVQIPFMSTILPESGIRERQLSGLMQSPAAQALMFGASRDLNGDN